MEEITNQTLHEIMKRVETGVGITNGRVRSLQIWRGYITGAVAVLTFLVVSKLINF